MNNVDCCVGKTASRHVTILYLEPPRLVCGFHGNTSVISQPIIIVLNPNCNLSAHREAYLIGMECKHGIVCVLQMSVGHVCWSGQVAPPGFVKS